GDLACTRALQPQHEREQRRSGYARRQDLAAPPAFLDLGDDRLRRRPAHETLMSRRASCSARYSSMLRLRSSDVRPSSLCSIRTPETYVSITWYFCSGVTIRS